MESQNNEETKTKSSLHNEERALNTYTTVFDITLHMMTSYIANMIPARMTLTLAPRNSTYNVLRRTFDIAPNKTSTNGMSKSQHTAANAR